MITWLITDLKQHWSTSKNVFTKKIWEILMKEKFNLKQFLKKDFDQPKRMMTIYKNQPDSSKITWPFETILFG